MSNPREIELHIGHFGTGTGASSIVDEVTYARKFMKAIYDILQKHNVPSTLYEDTTSKNKNANIGNLVKHHNADRDGLIVSGHLNASGGKTNAAIGFEVLYTTQKALSQKICDEVCKVSGLKNRGAKYRDDLGVLVKTYEPAVLLEFGFVNSYADVKILDEKFDDICFTIAKVLAAHIGHTIERSVTYASVRPNNKIGYSNTADANAFRLQSGRYDNLEAAQAAAEKLIANGSMNYVTIVGYKE